MNLSKIVLGRFPILGKNIKLEIDFTNATIICCGYGNLFLEVEALSTEELFVLEREFLKIIKVVDLAKDAKSKLSSFYIQVKYQGGITNFYKKSINNMHELKIIENCICKIFSEHKYDTIEISNKTENHMLLKKKNYRKEEKNEQK